MTREEAAWLAGFIDGEGTVSAQTIRHYVVGYVNVYNSHLGSLEVVVRLTGGSLSVNQRATERSKQGWKVGIWGESCRRTLRAILPFLVIKRTQAELVLKLMEIQGRRAGRRRADPEAQREILRTLKALNRKGPTGEPVEVPKRRQPQLRIEGIG